MGGILDKPNTDKHNEHGEGNGLRYGVSSMQGWRCEMEDNHYAKINLAETCVTANEDNSSSPATDSLVELSERLQEWSYFAVFDGHSGEQVSKHCAKNLLECILQTEHFRSDDIIQGIHTGFLELDSKMRDLPELAAGVDKSGTTVICAFVTPTCVYIANCGDSRAVLCRNGMPLFATRDHKPILPGEKRRIQAAGGTVVVQRVNGSLAVSRALGDYDYKNDNGLGQCDQLVSPEPEIFCQDRDEEDDFLVLACDGVWDVMTNDDVCQFVHNRLRITDNLEDVANQVIDTCLHKGSRDNMSIIIIVFPGAPKPLPEYQQAEEELEKKLRNTVKEKIENMDNVDNVEFRNILQCLREESISGLPPGGGLEAKFTFIAEVFKELCPDAEDTYM